MIFKRLIIQTITYLIRCLTIFTLLAITPNTVIAKDIDTTYPDEIANNNVEFVSSQIGGEFDSIFVKDQHAYLGVGKNLVILDIKNPENPFVTGTVKNFPERISDIFVTQTRAYVTDYQQLWIINIQNPTQPNILGSFKSPNPDEGCSAITATEQVAYLVCRTFIYSLDIVNPTQPNIIDSLPVPESENWVERIKLSNHYAYIANYDSGLTILDVSNPGNMQIVGSGPSSIFGDVSDVSIGVRDGEKIAYMISPTKGFISADVTDPNSIIPLGSIYSKGWPSQLFIQDDFAYVANQSLGLWVIDISNLESPVEAGNFQTNGLNFNVFLEGSVALLSNYSGGIQIVDISDTKNIKEISSYEEPVWTTDVSVKNNVAYTIGTTGLGAYDVSDPYNPKFISIHKSTNVTSIQIIDNDAYLGNGQGSFEIVNLQDPKNLQFEGKFTISTPVEPLPACAPPQPSLEEQPAIPGIYDISIYDRQAYLANGYAGIRILDISDPAHIIAKGIYKPPDSVYIANVQMVGKTAYVLDSGCWSLSGKLWIIDFSQLDHPTIISSIALPKRGTDLEIQGNYVYVTLGADGLRVIDIKDPTHPYIISTFSDNSESIYLQGNLAYLASSTKGLRVLNISDPSNPTELGLYNTSGVNGVYHSGCVTYLAQWGYGISLVGYTGDGENCSISGHIEDGLGNSISGINVSIDETSPNSAGQREKPSLRTVKTDSNGNYSIAGLSVNKYMVTPLFQGNFFYPSKREVQVATNIQNQDFVILEDRRIFLPSIRK